MDTAVAVLVVVVEVLEYNSISLAVVVARVYNTTVRDGGTLRRISAEQREK